MRSERTDTGLVSQRERAQCHVAKLVLSSVIFANSRTCLDHFLSDDLDVSPDFFEYFAATFPIMHADPTLWCVSAWNDNGKANMVSNEPGLFSSCGFASLHSC